MYLNLMLLLDVWKICLITFTVRRKYDTSTRRSTKGIGVEPLLMLQTPIPQQKLYEEIEAIGHYQAELGSLHSGSIMPITIVIVVLPIFHQE